MTNRKNLYDHVRATHLQLPTARHEVLSAGQQREADRRIAEVADQRLQAAADAAALRLG